LSALGFAGYVLFTRLFLAVLVSIVAILAARYSWWPHDIPAIVSLCIDMPLIPLVTQVLYPNGPDSNLAFILCTAFLYCPLYAGTGWIVGLILAHRNRRTVPAGISAADAPAKETCETGPCEPSRPPSEGG
jgi:hypothetical protein